MGGRGTGRGRGRARKGRAFLPVTWVTPRKPILLSARGLEA